MECCEVNNRVFLLGLDAWYRKAVKPHERGELLQCVRAVAAKVGAAPWQGPVEGYYAEDKHLTEYFRWVRALQQAPVARRADVANLKEFKRLWEVTSSPIYGRAVETGGLIPVGRDSLSEALDDTGPDWTLARLVDTAYRTSQETDDCSLVGLAALARDPVVLTALRESVVLYAELVFLEQPPPPRREFIWAVDEQVAQRSARFVEAFNRLFNERLPQPIAGNAEVFWNACDEAAIVGRCVRLGVTPPPARHYHWAICRAAGGALAVHEFWGDEPWTTQRYRQGLPASGSLRPPR